MMEIADLIHDALTHKDDPAAIAKIRCEVHSLTARYPLPG
jgi:glycine hydroxymethyltransferase